MSARTRRVVAVAVVGLAFLASALAYPSLPERVVTHWGATGRPDGWMARP